jgi:peptidoglycan/LPS O-acetylase OafA/YrhL
LEFWTYVAACVGLGILMAKIIEMPVLRFRDRVFPSGSTVRPAATWVENAEPVTQALP